MRRATRRLAILWLAALASLWGAGASVDAESAPPPQTKIAFTIWRAGPGVYTMNADGTSVRRLGLGAWPAWSPDGRQIAFQQRLNGHDALFVMQPDGSRRRLLTRDGRWPAWAPDGKRIAFVKSLAGATAVYVMGTDGRDVHLLEQNGGAPAWSPDGRRIAFVRYSGGIYVVNSDGSGRRQLTDLSGWAPAWSPDGSRIAFLGTDSHYHVMKADGTGLRRWPIRFDFKNQDCNLAWSPNGTTIAFTPHLAGGIELMRADGTGRVELAGTDSACGISWQRMPARP